MKHNPPFHLISAGIGMLLLIMDSRTALVSARSALDLIMNNVIPTLFPFFFLSIWLTSSNEIIAYGILGVVSSLLGIPKQYSYLSIPAFLGGYPTGAQAIAMAWRQGSLPKDNAEKMLGFCSNAGPSFLFGILGAFFPERWMCWALWGLHILGAIFAAQLIPCGIFDAVPMNQKNCCKSLPEVLVSSLMVTASVSGWVLLFRILIGFLDRWLFWLFPTALQVFICGLLELTNGCCMLDQIPDIRWRFLSGSVMLSLGGGCVLLQTKSVTNGLSVRWYLVGKTIQSVFCCIASLAIFSPAVIPLVIILFLGILIFTKKRSSIPPYAVV